MSYERTSLQVLREIDKLDRIGLDGVCAMLGDGMKDASGAFNKGVGLTPIQVGMIRLFFEMTTGHADNEQTLSSLRAAGDRLSQIRGRVDLMCALEESVMPSGKTLWDRFLSMPTTPNETWAIDGDIVSRPANVAWALDGILAALKARQSLTSAKGE